MLTPALLVVGLGSKASLLKGSSSSMRPGALWGSLCFSNHGPLPHWATQSGPAAGKSPPGMLLNTCWGVGCACSCSCSWAVAAEGGAAASLVFTQPLSKGLVGGGEGDLLLLQVKKLQLLLLLVPLGGGAVAGAGAAAAAAGAAAGAGAGAGAAVAAW